MFRSNMFTLAATWIYKQTKQNEKPNRKALKGHCEDFRSTPSYRVEIESVTPPPQRRVDLHYGQFWRHFSNVSQRVCIQVCLNLHLVCQSTLGAVVLFWEMDTMSLTHNYHDWLMLSWRLCVFSQRTSSEKSTLVQKRYSHSMWKHSTSRQKNTIFGANYSHGKHIKCVEAFIPIKGSINLKAKHRNMLHCMFWWWELSYNNKTLILGILNLYLTVV